MLSLIDLNPTIQTPFALPDRIYAVLKHRILTGVVPPGKRIVEKDICVELDISRTPLREALNRLTSEGLVILTPFRGYSVTPLSVEGFRSLCEVRRIVEPESAALAAQRATPEDIKALESTAEVHYTPGGHETYEVYVLRANSAFHQALVRCTRNRRLETMIMSALDEHQWPCYLGIDVGMDAEIVTSEHLGVVNAIRERDPSKARKLMRRHVEAAEERIVAALRTAGF